MAFGVSVRVKYICLWLLKILNLKRMVLKRPILLNWLKYWLWDCCLKINCFQTSKLFFKFDLSKPTNFCRMNSVCLPHSFCLYTDFFYISWVVIFCNLPNIARLRNQFATPSYANKHRKRVKRWNNSTIWRKLWLYNDIYWSMRQWWTLNTEHDTHIYSFNIFWVSMPHFVYANM